MEWLTRWFANRPRGTHRRRTQSRLSGPEGLEQRVQCAPVAAIESPVVPSAIPDDPGFAEQWGLRNQGQHGGTPTLDVDAVAAWDVTTGSRSVVVAVIDSGVDLVHPDLVGNLWRNPGEVPGNGIDDDANGFVDDVNGWDFVDGDAVPQDGFGHGTHVAGIIGAVGNNLRGVTGVAWQVSLMILRVEDDRGAGSTGAVLAALDYATRMRRDHGILVVATNNSWDAPAGYSGVMERAIRAQGEAGIMFVSAAGNQGSDVDVAPRYPGGYDLPNVINVAAATPTGELARLSNFGARGVDLAAPGTLITSTWPGGGIGTLSGTSMAAPYVSGAIALMASARPDLTVEQTRAAILGSTRPIASQAGRTVTGGMLDVRRALAAIGAGPALVEPGTGNGGVTGPAAGAAVANPGGGLPLTDSFARAGGALDTGGWRRLQGRVLVVGGAAVSAARGESLVLRDDVMAGDVSVSLAYAVGQARAVGVVARADAAGLTLYRARVVRTASGLRAQIHRRLDGRWMLLATGPATPRGTLRFDLTAADQRLSIDGTTVARARDAAIPAAGRVGIDMIGIGGRASDFRAA